MKLDAPGAHQIMRRGGCRPIAVTTRRGGGAIPSSARSASFDSLMRQLIFH
jgi:hypothetical protein